MSPTIIRKTYLIQKDSTTFYVPRPQGWISGLARHHWIKKHWQIEPHIASPDLWKQLQEHYPTYILTEDEDGVTEWKSV